MSFLVAGLAICVAIFFATKYFRQRSAVRLLADSLASRSSILSHTEDFRGRGRSWSVLVDELNRLIEEFGDLSRQNRGQLDQIETTLGSLQEGVVIVDRDNYVLLANSALQAMFPGMKGRAGQRIESGMRSSDFLDFVREAKQSERPAKREIAFAVGQEEVWVEATAAHLPRGEEGNGPWHLFVLHDVTKQKRLEQARKRFVANASHELKTPVAVIKGYAETLVTDSEVMGNDDRVRFLDTIHRHSERLALLINDLLSLSRLENDTPTFAWVEADIIGWLREAARDYDASNSDRGTTRIKVTLDDGLVAPAKFDALKLRQVLDNLIGNATKYSPEGGEVSIEAKIVDSEIVIAVQDEGVGVPEEDLSRIFERFYRVDKGRSRETGGTGLGLSIVKHIVEWHEGRVWAENATGGGLRVSFSLPLLDSASADLPVSTGPATSTEPSPEGRTGAD